MEVFLANITSFPTAIYTVVVAVMFGFWLLNLTGLFNFDALDIDLDIDLDAQTPGIFASIMINLGLTGVPFTVVLTILNTIAWLLSYYAVHFGLSLLEPGLAKTLVGISILIVSFAIALPITALVIQPMRGFFSKLNDESTEQSLLGATCTVRTSRVDKEFGEAECSLDGLSHIIKVRCESFNNLKHGDKAVIVDHDQSAGFYYVEQNHSEI